MTTAEQRAEWRRLEQAATPGEWFFQTGNDKNGDSCDVLVAEIEGGGDDEEQEYAQVLFDTHTLGDKAASDNWEFCAAARTAVPALLADVEELLAEREDLLPHLNSAVNEDAD
jgi:hypothetical protein